MPNISTWPVPDFARPFYREIQVGGFSYLVPCTKLGQGQINKANAARRNTAIAALAAAGIADPDDEAIAKYVKDNWASEDVQTAWFGALYIPIGDAPPLSAVFDFFPPDVLSETTDFFLASVDVPTERSSETKQPSPYSSTSPTSPAQA